MSVVERYIFRRLLGSFAVAFPALAISIWLSQALRELSLVTDRGQGLTTFLEASVLLIPGLIVIIAPVTMLIVVISTINTLNADSELVSLGAAGASPAVMLKPVFLLALPLALLSASCSLYFNPAAARASASLIEEVNASLLTSLIRPGQFRSLGDDVVIQVRSVHPDGTLEGIFVFDRRAEDETVAYLAGAGAMFENEAGQFLLMQEGVIQRRPLDGTTVSIIQFQSYAFDLSALGSQNPAAGIRPNERDTAYLLDPDPSDPIFQDNPFRYTAELHNRLTIPLYVLALALFPLALLGQVQTARQGRGLITTVAAVGGGAILGAGLYLSGAIETNEAMAIPVYGVPLTVIVLSTAFVWSGRRPPAIGFRRSVGALRRRSRQAGAEP